MKFRFEIVYRLGLALLLVVACWSVWANAQPVPATNAPSASGVSTNQFQMLTFGLENVPALEQRTFLEQPLWKYIASLIYILLAFYVSKC